MAGAHAAASGEGLRARLKQATGDLHRRAEQSGVMRQILQGRVQRAAYGALLRNLREIYAGLEAGLATHERHPLLAPIVLRPLFRLPYLEHDLHHLAGASWASDLAVKPAAVAYRRRLGEIAHARPGLLAAHAYVRYVNDLSGGQILHRLVAERLALGHEGTRFYQFGSEHELDLLVTRLRVGLDEIPATAEEADAIVDEAQQAFRRHIDLFLELAA